MLYIGHQTKNTGTPEERQNELHDRFEVFLERLKEKLNVCLESFYTDNTVYFEEESDFRIYCGRKRLPPEEQQQLSSHVGGMGVYRICFNFTPRIDDMLMFFYAVANDFQMWGGHTIEKIYSIRTGQRVDSGLSRFNRNFLPKFRWSDESTHIVSQAIIRNFWENERVLDLPDDLTEQTAYVEDRINRFVRKIQAFDEKRKEYRDD